MTFDSHAAWLALAVGLAVVLGWLLARRLFGPPLAGAKERGLRWLRGGVLAALAAIGLDPCWRDETSGALRRPEFHVLIDRSQSMALGTPEPRLAAAETLVRDALRQADGHAEVRLHRFGQRLAPLAAEQLGEGKPEDADTLLAPALQQLAGRFGRRPPAGVFIVSDGQARDGDAALALAGWWKRLGVPLHVVPIGQAARGGDAAVVAVIAPGKVRKHTTVEVSALLRSFGYGSKRTELRVQALDDAGQPRRTIAALPVQLADGVQTATVSFRVDRDERKYRLHLPPAADDIAPANNGFAFELEIDRNKVRVLHLEGAGDSLLRTARRLVNGDTHLDDADAAYAPFRDALQADPDLECATFLAVPGSVPRRVAPNANVQYAGFPQTPAELMAYDVLALSDVSRDSLPAEFLAWVEEWIGRRGGGLLMAGGPRSFGAGGWRGSALETLLPVELTADDWNTTPVHLSPPVGGARHPIWALYEDDAATAAALAKFPELPGRQQWPKLKAELGIALATEKSGAAPLLAVGHYGRGRVAAWAPGLSDAAAAPLVRQWGENDNRHFARFARNLSFWLAEESGIARRRLVASADKRFYRPGETIKLVAQTFDENARRTGAYKVAALLEPKSLEGDLPPSPVRWPAGVPHKPGESGTLVDWGVEIDLAYDPKTESHRLELPLTDVISGGPAGQGFKIELAASEGKTQVDSGSVDIQALSDPYEQQNPLPNHALLAKLADATGGTVVSDAAALSKLLTAPPLEAAPSTVRLTPAWSRGPVLALLLGLLCWEWLRRRRSGLA